MQVEVRDNAERESVLRHIEWYRSYNQEISAERVTTWADVLEFLLPTPYEELPEMPTRRDRPRSLRPDDVVGAPIHRFKTSLGQLGVALNVGLRAATNGFRYSMRYDRNIPKSFPEGYAGTLEFVQIERDAEPVTMWTRGRAIRSVLQAVQAHHAKEVSLSFLGSYLHSCRMCPIQGIMLDHALKAFMCDLVSGRHPIVHLVDRIHAGDDRSDSSDISDISGEDA